MFLRYLMQKFPIKYNQNALVKIILIGLTRKIPVISTSKFFKGLAQGADVPTNVHKWMITERKTFRNWLKIAAHIR